MTKSKHKEAHASSAKKGIGDYYGSGIKNKVGRMRDGFGINAVRKKGLKTPPRSLA